MPTEKQQQQHFCATVIRSHISRQWLLCHIVRLLVLLQMFTEHSHLFEIIHSKEFTLFCKLQRLPLNKSAAKILWWMNEIHLQFTMQHLRCLKLKNTFHIFCLKYIYNIWPCNRRANQRGEIISACPEAVCLLWGTQKEGSKRYVIKVYYYFGHFLT